MATSTHSITEDTNGVKPPCPTHPLERPRDTKQAAMWKRITELEPLINRVARYLSRIYDEDADELASRMTLVLAEKARTKPAMLRQCDAFIAKCLKNEIYSYYRHLYGVGFRFHKVPLDELEGRPMDDDTSDDIERKERAEALRSTLASLDDQECRTLIEGILKAGDSILYHDKNTRRPCNVAKLAKMVGMSPNKAYIVMDRLTQRLEPIVAGY